MMWRAAFYE